MVVRATQRGFHGTLIEKGQAFNIEESKFDPTWMVKIGTTEEKAVLAETKKKRASRRGMSLGEMKPRTPAPKPVESPVIEELEEGVELADTEPTETENDGDVL
jgi:hypothetical protein